MDYIDEDFNSGTDYGYNMNMEQSMQKNYQEIYTKNKETTSLFPKENIEDYSREELVNIREHVLDKLINMDED